MKFLKKKDFCKVSTENVFALKKDGDAVRVLYAVESFDSSEVDDNPGDDFRFLFFAKGNWTMPADALDEGLITAVSDQACFNNGGITYSYEGPDRKDYINVFDKMYETVFAQSQGLFAIVSMTEAEWKVKKKGWRDLPNGYLLVVIEEEAADDLKLAVA